MAKFTKWNNPNKKKRPRKKLDRTEREILACKEMMIDRKLGYNISTEYYEQRWNLKGDKN